MIIIIKYIYNTLIHMLIAQFSHFIRDRVPNIKRVTHILYYLTNGLNLFTT